MSKLALLVLFAALLAVSVQATGYASYDAICAKHGGSSRKCASSASLNLVVVGRGRCVGSATGYCAAYTARSRNCIDKEKVYIRDKKCRDVKVTKDAKCWAFAAAKAMTKASVGVICNGDYAKGCAEASAEAEALACSVAAAIVDINIKVGRHNKAKCDAKVAVLTSAIAKATAESQAKACSKNGRPGFDTDKDLALAFEKVAAEAFASCVVYCDKDGKTGSEATGGGFGDVVDSGEFTFGDDADTHTGPFGP